MVKIFVESANENAKNDFLGQLAKTFVKLLEKRTYWASVFRSTKREKSCENKEGKSFQVVLFRYRHLKLVS